MAKLQNHFLSVGYIDELAEGDSYIHRLDPLAKVLTVLVFIVTVVSFDKYTFSQLLPFFIFPFVIISAGGVPAVYILKSVLYASPFAIMVGMFNPFIDHTVITVIGGVEITGGLLSFISILLKFSLTVSSVFVLMSVTGFYNICKSLERLYVPKPFIVQLMFLYRYIFVIAEEGSRMSTAKDFRSFGKVSGVKVYVSLLGHLLLRSLDRAQRIHLAMFSRGYDGEIHTGRKSKLNRKDIAFIAIWCGLFILFRIYDMPLLIGSIFTGEV